MDAYFVRAIQDHAPHGRGYHVAVNYFHHANDYWSMATDSCQVPPSGPPPPPSTCQKGHCGRSGQCLGASPNLHTTWTRVAEDCCKACGDTEGCAGWAWGHNSGRDGNYSCNLKSAVMPTDNGNCTSACSRHKPGQFLSCLVTVPVVDLWEKVENGTEGPAHGANGSCTHPNLSPPGPQPDDCKPGIRDVGVLVPALG